MVAQKKLKNKYEDPDFLPKSTKRAGMMKSIKEYFRIHHGVMKAPLLYTIRKNIGVYIWPNSNYIFMTLGTFDAGMSIRMLHAPIHVSYKNFNTLETRPEQTEIYRLGNRIAYEILNQINKDMNLYSFVYEIQVESQWMGDIQHY